MMSHHDVTLTTKAYLGGLRLEPSVELTECFRNGRVNKVSRMAIREV